jgi:hypothetical protein
LKLNKQIQRWRTSVAGSSELIQVVTNSRKLAQKRWINWGRLSEFARFFGSRLRHWITAKTQVAKKISKRHVASPRQKR